jgi:hypothetical protein
MKNKRQGISTSESVRDEDGQPPHLPGRRKFLRLAAGATAFSTASHVARAQAYPSRPITIVVGDWRLLLSAPGCNKRSPGNH